MSEVPAGSFVTIAGLYVQAKSLLRTAAAEGSVDASLPGEAKIFLAEAAEGVDELLRTSPDNPRLAGASLALRYEHAKLTAAAGDEPAAAEELRCLLESAGSRADLPEVAYVALRVVNYLAYLLTKNGELEEARDVLERGNRFYDGFKTCGGGEAQPYTVDDLLQEVDVALPGDDAARRLENLQTSNVEMLGFVHNKRGDADAFVRCHHAVLRRQLEAGEPDAASWARRVVRLASHFLVENRFGEARRHLAAATAVLDRADDGGGEEDQEATSGARADVSRCWVKYVLALFTVSRGSAIEQMFSEERLNELWELPYDASEVGRTSSQAVVRDILEEMWVPREEKEAEEPGRTEDQGDGNDAKKFTRPSAAEGDLEELTKTDGASEADQDDGDVANKSSSSPTAEGDLKDPVKREDANTADEHDDEVAMKFSSSPAAEGDLKDPGKTEDANTADEHDDEVAMKFSSSPAAEGDLKDPGKTEDANAANQGNGDDAKNPPDDESEFSFPGLDSSFLEDTVLATYVETAQQARELVQFAQAHWRLASAAGGRDDEEAALMLAELQRHLASYESDDEDARYAAQRRRAEALRSSALGRAELAQAETELVRLSLRRMWCAPGDALRKMMALQDLHARLGLLCSGALPSGDAPATIPAVP